ncbi:MAG TPA: helix-turn-helix transcriptional regulator [Solirubrobacterales bacterium]|nr:helix-turn-helix transcriptional regulator [Solirubrobacterales bacterium]
MKIEASNSDSVVLAELGARLARTRLEQNLSQQSLAEEAGVSKATIERLEAGEPVKSTSLVRVLRSLGRLDALDRLLPQPLPSPVQRLRLQGRQRRRASSPRGGSARSEPSPWRWADDSAPDRPR